MSATIRKATLAYVRVASLSTRLLHALPQWQKKTDTPKRVPVGRESAKFWSEVLSKFEIVRRFLQEFLVDLEKTLQKEYSLAKIGADTAENEPSKVRYFDMLVLCPNQRKKANILT